MKIEHRKTDYAPEIKNYGEKSIAIISNQWSLSSIEKYDIDAIVVKRKEFISQIRKNDELYLLPLFIMETPCRQVDGTFDPYHPYAIFDRIDQIKESTRLYKGLKLPEEDNERTLTKLLRFLCSRSEGLEVEASRLSSIGYEFSLLEDYSFEANRLHLIKLMDSYVSQGYFTTNIRDKVNLCNECSGSYLNFAECCSQCGDLGLITENLIHHFRCAYVGPESDFKKEDRLICPKCDKHLKHIGIDYDKPSEIHTCGRCNHRSQETKMNAKCVDCRTDNKLSQLTTVDICDYEVTEKGRNMALSMDRKELKEKDELLELGIITHNKVYQLLKEHESKKKDFYNNDIYEINVSISPSLFHSLNDSSIQGLLSELSSIIKPYLRGNDILTIKELKIKVLLINYYSKEADEVRDILHYNLNKMLSDNGLGADLVNINLQSIE